MVRLARLTFHFQPFRQKSWWLRRVGKRARRCCAAAPSCWGRRPPPQEPGAPLDAVEKAVVSKGQGTCCLDEATDRTSS